MSAININLLPSAQKQRLFVFDRVLGIGLALIALEVLAIIAFTAVLTSKITDLNDQIAAEQVKLAAVQAQVKDVIDMRDQVQDLEAKVELLERVRQSPIQLAEILSDLSYNTPGGVWFSNVTVNHSTSGGSVTLEGKTSTYREVADLMLNLDSSPMFGDAILTTSRKALEGQTQQSGGNVTFSMNGALSPAVIGQ